MNTVSKCLFGGALLGAGLSNAAAADIVNSGTIEVQASDFAYDFGANYGAYNYGQVEIDSINFTVLSDSDVTFDMLSYQIFDTWIDPVIMLFQNDGNPLSDSNLVEVNDDNTTGSDTNGSLGSLDSFMTIFLTAGDYTVTVGAWEYTTDDAEAGFGVGTVAGIGGFVPTSGEYQLDIIGNVVPAPGALALLGLGGLAAGRRRR
tara:strand:+ start:2325 stop:2933 length:609 start_codon:yes stop_codon:yes gene_type:complete